MTRTARYPDRPSRIHLNANRDLRFQLALGGIVLNFYSRFNGLVGPSFPPSPSLAALGRGGPLDDREALSQDYGLPGSVDAEGRLGGKSNYTPQGGGVE